MTQTANAILDTLLQLSDADRAELTARLLDSLDVQNRDGDEAEWEKEIGTRVEEVRTGQVKPIPWATAREQIVDDVDGGS